MRERDTTMCRPSRNIFGRSTDLLQKSPWSRAGAPLCLCIVFTVCSVATIAAPLRGQPANGVPESDELRQGIAAVKRNDLAASYALLGQAIQSNPDSAPAHFWLGVANLKDGQVAKAEESFHKAIALN